MIKHKKYKITQPTAESKHDLLDPVVQEINEFLAANPDRKLINIEHVVSTARTSGGYDSFFICLWYSE